MLAKGENPYPVRLVRPPRGTAVGDGTAGRADLLRCQPVGLWTHVLRILPQSRAAFRPAERSPACWVARAGPAAPPPTLTYLERHPPFSVGPDNDEDENSSVPLQVALARGTKHAPKTAHNTADSAANLVPQGGLFWDGRVDTLQEQAIQPLLNPIEMANPSAAAVAAKLRRARYASSFAQLFGATILDEPTRLVSEAMFAVARFQIEEPAFHPYSSKFDSGWKARLASLRRKCAATCCSTTRTRRIAVAAIWTSRRPTACRHCSPTGSSRRWVRRATLRWPANRDPAYFDLGICGPYRDDMRTETQFCGMFITPTLRNVATRHVFFHNGVFTSLQQVMDFYAFRDVAPEKVYPSARNTTTFRRTLIGPMSMWWTRRSIVSPATRRR